MDIALLLLVIWLVGYIISAFVLARIILKMLVPHGNANREERMLVGGSALVVSYFWPIVLFLGGGAWLITRQGKRIE